MDEHLKQMMETLDRDQKLAEVNFPGFKADTLDIRIFGIENKDCPVVYANTIPGEDYEFWQKCQAAKLPPFVLVGITNLNWCTDLAPWYVRPTGPTHTACFPGAEKYIKVLSDTIVPKAEGMLSFQVKRRFLAGYSLAGLFAYWSLYQTDLFERLILGSGSFWFPDFEKYVQEHKMVRKPLSVYFSLGRQESHTEYPIFNTVQTRTEWLENYTKEQGIDTVFVLEPGNHYDDPPGRMERGMAWTFEQIQKES